MPRRRRGHPVRWLVVVLSVIAAGAIALRWFESPPDSTGPGAATRPLPAAARNIAPANCGGSSAGSDVIKANTESLGDLAWSLSGRDALGWEIYAPLAQREVATACPPDSQGFALALSRWQAAHGLSASGRMDATSFETMWVAMLVRRPFVRAMRFGCPAPLAASELELAQPDETFARQTTIMAGRQALQAYRTLLAAARANAPAIRTDPQALTIISAFRAPQLDGSDCPLGQVCSNLTRANCSAHQTGTAMDLYLGAAPGRGPADSDDSNRLYQAASPAYIWLVRNAARFGFAPYPFEPWHWEWTGEAP